MTGTEMYSPAWQRSHDRYVRSQRDHVEVRCGSVDLVVPPGFRFVAQNGYGVWWAFIHMPRHYPGSQSLGLCRPGNLATGLKRTKPVKNWRDRLYQLPRARPRAFAHQVLLVYPHAYAYHWTDRWTIYSLKTGYPGTSIPLGDGETEALAWSAAAAGLAKADAAGRSS